MSSGFVAGTLVHTDKGLVPIQNLKVGDLVWTNFFADDTKNLQPIKNVFRLDKEEVFALRFIDNFIAPDPEDFFEPVMNLPNMKPSRINLEILSSNQKIWVNGDIEQEISQGWYSANKLNGGEKFQFKDNQELGSVISTNNLGKTHIRNVLYLNTDGDYVSFVIDLRDEQIIIYYITHLVLDAYDNQFNAEQHLPLAENIVVGNLNKHEILNEIINLIRNPLWDNFAELKVVSLEVAENHNFYVGNLGILVGDSTIQGNNE